MCYAIPAKILKIDKNSVDGATATLDYGGITKTANISLIDNPQIGDYVLIHAGFAIEKLNKKSAEESLAIIRRQIGLTEKTLKKD